VVQARLHSEYGTRCSIEPIPYVAARWPVSDATNTTRLTLTTSGVLVVIDRLEREVILFESEWQLQYIQKNNPHVQFMDSM
jgi:peptide subunit release factor RF-3